MRILGGAMLASALIAACGGAGGVVSVTRTGVGAEAHAARGPRAATRAPRKRALLVGVSGYCRGDSALCVSGSKYWWNLNTGADVAAIEQVLKSKFGFDEVKTLTTREETTHRNIAAVFRSFLVGQTNKGDIAYFHFSGHGAQVPDDNKHGPNPDLGDEIDGLDESLVPSDYVSQDDGSNNIRDDELSGLLTELKAKNPANVTVTMDSCFSGSSTRGGSSLVRGGRWEGAAPAAGRGAKPEGPGGLLSSGEARSKGLTVLSATRNDQLAFETEDDATHTRMGTFSYALVKALESADSSTTYRDVIESVTDAVTRRQRNQEPQIEGDRDVLLMSGVPVRPPQPYVETQIRGDRIYLTAGRLQGVSEGSVFALYPQGGAPKKSEPLAGAEVETVQLTTAALKVAGPTAGGPVPESFRGARAFELTHNFGDVRLKVAAHNLAPSEAGREVAEALKSSSMVNAVADSAEGWDVRVCSNNCPDETTTPEGRAARLDGGFTVQRSDGSVIERVNDGVGASEGVRLALEGEARWRFIKGLNNENDPDVRIKMRLVPVADVEVDEETGLASKARKLTAELTPGEGGQLAVRVDDYLMLEVMNLGSEDVWVSVLDINNDGAIGPLWPHPDIPVGLSGENRIPGTREGQPVWTPVKLPFVVHITKPCGWETFKAIATLNKTNFAPLFQPSVSESIQRGERRGGSESQTVLGQVLMTAVTGLARGRGDVAGADPSRVVVPPGWGSASVTFTVRPKQ
jgi:hypothetical protein